MSKNIQTALYPPFKKLGTVITPRTANDTLEVINIPEKTYQAENIYVSTTGSDTTGTGTLANPYRTRQKAYDTLPEFIDHRITINLAAGTYTDTAEFPEVVIGPSGSVTIIGAYTRSVLYTCTGGDNVDANGYSNFVVSGAGWTPDEHKGKMIEIITQLGGAVSTRFLPIYSNTADTLYCPMIYFTPTGATTFYIASPDTVISGTGLDLEIINKSNITSVGYTSGLYTKYRLQYETIKFSNFDYAISNRSSFCSLSGIWFNKTVASDYPCVYNDGGVVFGQGIYLDGECNKLIQDNTFGESFTAYSVQDYSAYTGSGHIYGFNAGINSTTYGFNFIMLGRSGKNINSACIANGTNSVANIYNGRIDWCNNVLRSRDGGVVASAISNGLYGTNCQKLFNIKSYGRGFINSQSNLTYSVEVDVDDTGTAIRYVSAYDECEGITKSLYNRNVVAGSSVGPARQLQSLTAAAAITLTSTPTITAGSVSGEEIELVGTSDTNTVTLQDEAALAGTLIKLKKGTLITLRDDESIRFRWDGTYWREISRSRIKPVISTKSSTFTPDFNSDVYRCNGTFNITLPAATGSGFSFELKNASTGVLTVEANGTDSIDGESSQTMNDYENLVLRDAASGEWDII